MWNKSKINAGPAGRAARAAQGAVLRLPVGCCSLEMSGEGGWPDRTPRRRRDRPVVWLAAPGIKLLTCARATRHPKVTSKTINVSKCVKREPLSRKEEGWWGCTLKKIWKSLRRARLRAVTWNRSHLLVFLRLEHSFLNIGRGFFECLNVKMWSK